MSVLFFAELQAEMESSGDSATLNMSEVRKNADKEVQNNGNSLEELEKLVVEHIINS